MMQCPTCGSPEIYRSRRGWFERLFNWLFWYQQRPYRCAVCLTRYWVHLEPRVWRHTIKIRAAKALRTWGLYIGALLLAMLVAWSMNALSGKAQHGNGLLDTALDRGLRKKLDQRELSPEQKEQAKKFFKQKK